MTKDKSVDKSEIYKPINENCVALVLSTIDDWDNCCITEYLKDGTWVCGLNLITSVKDALRSAEKYKLNIIMESQLQK